MKIYTKTGDEGLTGLFGGERVSKAHSRIESLGSLDELNASIGLARTAGSHPEIDAALERTQFELFDLGAELGTPHSSPYYKESISSKEITRFEVEMDAWTEKLEPLRHFVLPGGTALAAQLHLSRTICRRTERLLVASAVENEFRAETVVYLNRLSDWLFVLARYANHIAGVPDVKWLGRAERPE